MVPALTLKFSYMGRKSEKKSDLDYSWIIPGILVTFLLGANAEPERQGRRDIIGPV